MGSQQNNNHPKTLKFDKFRENLLNGVLRFDDMLSGLDDQEIYVKSLTFKAPDDDRAGWLVVIRAMREGIPVVGFHNGDTFGEVLKGTTDRLSNRSVRWKEDQYA